MMPFDPRLEMDCSASPFRYIWSWIIWMSFVRCTLSCMCILNFSVNTVYDRALPLHKGSCIEGMSFLASNLKRASAIVTVSGLELERLVSFNSTRSSIQESNAMAILVWGLTCWFIWETWMRMIGQWIGRILFFFSQSKIRHSSIHFPTCLECRIPPRLHVVFRNPYEAAGSLIILSLTFTEDFINAF